MRPSYRNIFIFLFSLSYINNLYRKYRLTIELELITFFFFTWQIESGVIAKMNVTLLKMFIYFLWSPVFRYYICSANASFKWKRSSEYLLNTRNHALKNIKTIVRFVLLSPLLQISLFYIALNSFTKKLR